MLQTLQDTYDSVKENTARAAENLGLAGGSTAADKTTEPRRPLVHSDQRDERAPGGVYTLRDRHVDEASRRDLARAAWEGEKRVVDRDR